MCTNTNTAIAKGRPILPGLMLKHIGFDARLCWTYSGNSCYDRDIPSLAVDNHMICAVQLNGSFIYLDPTAKYSYLFQINENIQGKGCLMENADGPIVAQIPEIPFDYNLKLIRNRAELSGNKLSIDGQIDLKGADKNIFQYYLNHLPTDNKEDLVNFFVTNKDNNFLINSIKTAPADSMAEEFSIVYNMDVSNEVIEMGDEILLGLDFYKEYQDATIDTLRKLNYTFNYRCLLQHEISFDIPHDYEVVSLPEPLLIDKPKYHFMGKYSVEGSLLIYRKKIALKENILLLKEFKDWNEAIGSLVEFYNEMIILKKT
ncbi:MAG: hypothetical protein R2764_14025 [Bacteroidales bacterium]